MKFKCTMEDTYTGKKSTTERRITTPALLVNSNNWQWLAVGEAKNSAVFLLLGAYKQLWGHKYKDGDKITCKMTIELEENVSCSVQTNITIGMRTIGKLQVPNNDAENEIKAIYEDLINEIFNYFNSGGKLVIRDLSGYKPLKEIDKLPTTVYQPKFIDKYKPKQQGMEFITINITIPKLKCECGKDKFGFAKHLEGCPKYDEKIDQIGVL